MSPPVELHLVHRPHGALHVLHPAEALVEGEVVSHCVLDKTTISDKTTMSDKTRQDKTTNLVNVTAKVKHVIYLNQENTLKDGRQMPFLV